MLDTHAHLNFPQLLDQIDQVVGQSKKAGLTGIVVASSCVEDSKKAIELTRKYSEFLWASIGIHPQKTDPSNAEPVKEQLSQLEQLINENREIVKAVGETGMDFSQPPRRQSPSAQDNGGQAPGEEERSKEEQQELFLGQINLALKYNLPLIVHAREANDQVIESIKAMAKNTPGVCFGSPGVDLKGVFHCYSGGKKRVQKVLDLPGDWYFGIDGNLTYDQGLQNVFKLIPKDRLVLETDAPFLPPEPHRGEINTPAYLPLILEKVAEIWGESLKKTDQVISKNTKRLFGA